MKLTFSPSQLDSISSSNIAWPFLAGNYYPIAYCLAMREDTTFHPSMFFIINIHFYMRFLHQYQSFALRYIIRHEGVWHYTYIAPRSLHIYVISLYVIITIIPIRLKTWQQLSISEFCQSHGCQHHWVCFPLHKLTIWETRRLHTHAHKIAQPIPRNIPRYFQKHHQTHYRTKALSLLLLSLSRFNWFTSPLSLYRCLPQCNPTPGENNQISDNWWCIRTDR